MTPGMLTFTPDVDTGHVDGQALLEASECLWHLLASCLCLGSLLACVS